MRYLMMILIIMAIFAACESSFAQADIDEVYDFNRNNNLTVKGPK